MTHEDEALLFGWMQTITKKKTIVLREAHERSEMINFFPNKNFTFFPLAT